MKKIAVTAGKSIAAIAFWVAVWFIIAKIIDVELIVPTPFAVWRALCEIIVTEEFWISCAMSFLRVLFGIGISFIVGCGIAYLTWRSKILNSLLSPLLSIIKATPVASFIIIAWIWFDTSLLPIFIASLIVIPIITSNVLQGISSVDKDLKEVAKIYRFSVFKRLFRLYIPSIAPYFLAACRSSLGMAWKASVAAEMIVLSQNSIGKEIYNTKLYSMEAAPVFAWTIVVIILSIVIEKLLLLSLNAIGRAAKILPKGEKYAEN
ncbi:MAG: ABC transporter permease subunit [Clostridia bacterium]|nr:ABC transporter permease subunit [Clostridia bacterium]